MADGTNPKYLDKRTAERYLKGGQLDEKVYEKHMKGLPDVAEKAAVVETRMGDEIEDEEVEDEVEEEASEAEPAGEEDDGVA